MAEYIERDAVLSAIWKMSAEHDVFFPAIILDAIKSIPAADVRPVVRGKWIKIKYRSICRDCSFRGFASWNFCPNCGADRREPPKEET